MSGAGRAPGWIEATAPHHDGSAHFLRTSGAPGIGDVVRARVHVPHTADRRGEDVQLVCRRMRDAEPAWTTGEVEHVDGTGAWWGVDVPVDGPVTSYRFLLGRGGAGGGYAWLNAAGVVDRDVTDAHDFRVSAHRPAPDWVTDQVVYQVFPDRFARSGVARETPGWAYAADWDEPVEHRGPKVGPQWYGGDLDGVAAHLDHLRDLGATLLYLTPTFEGRSNHRYDAVSFDRMDPALGGDEAMVRLIGAAHAAGLRVMGDLTLNHTGVGHEWFRRAQADATSVEAGFYSFRHHPDDYETWIGVRSLPKLDHRSAELARRLYAGRDSVVGRWLLAGQDAWRIDVANMTGRLRDVDLAHEVARATRRTFAEVAPAGTEPGWLLAEHGHDASADLLGDGWHGTMDYTGFTRPVWAWLNGGSEAGPGLAHGLQFLGLPLGIPVLGGHQAVATIREAHAAMGWRAWTASTAHLDSHDTPRFRTVAGGGTHGWVDSAGHGRARHLLGLALQMTMPGVPTVYAGDELGLTAVDGEHSRTPFPWHRAAEWDAPTLDAYRTWGRLRRDHVALRRGGLRWLAAGPESVTYLREHDDERLLVHVVRSAHDPVVLPASVLGVGSVGEVEVLHGSAPRVTPTAVELPYAEPGAHLYALPHSG